MPLTPYACENCGFWQRYFAPPPDCPVCTDVRNDLPEDGWQWLPAEDAAARYGGTVHEVAPGFYQATTSPGLGLAGSGWLTVREEGNIAFEAAPYYSRAMLGEIERLGGILYLGASHVHGYGALWQLQDAFEPEVLAIHVGDLQLTKAFRVSLPYEDTQALAPGFTLYHTGGHYEGQAALYDHDARRLFCGDMFKVDQDTDGNAVAISTHKAFHKNIPMTHAELRRYRAVIEPLDFTSVCTPFEHAPDVDRALCLAVLDRALSEPPSVSYYQVSEL